MVKSTKDTKYYGVFNLGLRSIRLIIFDSSGSVLEKSWYPVQTIIEGDKVEQNPNEWWQLTIQLLNEVLDKNKEYVNKLDAITFTSSAACLVVTDDSGKPLVNSFMVSDKRAAKQAEILAHEPSLADIFKNPNNLAVPSYMFPKILWLKQHQPKIFSKAAYFMSINDFFVHRFTGKVITDTLNAEKFYYDSSTNRYPKNLLKYASLNDAQLPQVVEPGTVVGFISKSLSHQLGLKNQVKVVVSTYDAICAFLGSGVADEGDTCNVCGTVSSVRALTKRNGLVSKNGILLQKLHSYHIVGGSNNIDGGLLEWSKDMFYGDSYPEKYVYKIMEDEAEASPAGARGIIFSPYIIGERLPFFDSVTRGIFFGLERFHKRSDMLRSIFEASGFMVKDIIDTIETVGVKVKQIHMSGGLTRNKIACKIRADITGKPVLVIDETETTALGAHFIILKATGVIKSLKHSSKFVTIAQRYMPHSENHAFYKKYFSLFKKVYEQNRKLMDERRILL